MILSKKYNFIFIHIWKTGGTSVRESLIKGIHKRKFIQKLNVFYDRVIAKLTRIYLNKPISFIGILIVPSHLSATELKNLIGEEKYNRYFKFAFVRNPWDFYISLYLYIRQSKKHPHHKIISKLSFGDFLEIQLKNNEFSQKKMIYDKNGNLLVDYIGRFENINDDFAKICNILGIENNLIHINKTKRSYNYRDYYDDYLRKKVAEIAKEDIETFNYEF
jgi:hypothetical protein